MDTFDVDGLTYSSDIPHSRIEKELMEILENMKEDEDTGD